MTTLSQPQDLARLQRLRASVLAFQNRIASLPAKDKNNALNEQFNQLRSEAKALLHDPAFDKKVPRAITEEVQGERLQKKILPRLFAVITFGVGLALLGLAINSIFLDELIVNIFGCLVSSSGILLIVGAYIVFRLNRVGGRISNYGDVYQLGEALLYQLAHALNLSEPAGGQLPDVPSVVELLLDSLQKQVLDWEEKLARLEAQRRAAGLRTGLELNVNIDFVQRELERVNREISALNGRPTSGRRNQTAGPALLPATVAEAAAPAADFDSAADPAWATGPDPESEPQPDHEAPPAGEFADFPARPGRARPAPKKATDRPTPQVIERARANTMGMPALDETETNEGPEEDATPDS
jgi:hypothetical protein